MKSLDECFLDSFFERVAIGELIYLNPEELMEKKNKWHQLNMRIPKELIEELDRHVDRVTWRDRGQLITDILRFWTQYQNSLITMTPAQLAAIRPYLPKGDR